MNKVINITLFGGLVGLLAESPHLALRKAINGANSDGWKVVQVVPAASGSFIYAFLQTIVLLLTLLIFTFKPGYYVVLERASGSEPRAPQVDPTLRCPKCSRKVTVDDSFCEGCGTKLK